MRDRAAAKSAAASWERARQLLNSDDSTFETNVERYQAAVMADAISRRRRMMRISGSLAVVFLVLAIVIAVFGGGWLFLAPAVFSLVPGAAWVIERNHPPDPYGDLDTGTITIGFPRK